MNKSDYLYLISHLSYFKSNDELLQEKLQYEKESVEYFIAPCNREEYKLKKN